MLFDHQLHKLEVLSKRDSVLICLGKETERLLNLGIQQTSHTVAVTVTRHHINFSSFLQYLYRQVGVHEHPHFIIQLPSTIVHLGWMESFFLDLRHL